MTLDAVISVLLVVFVGYQTLLLAGLFVLQTIVQVRQHNSMGRKKNLHNLKLDVVVYCGYGETRGLRSTLQSLADGDPSRRLDMRVLISYRARSKRDQEEILSILEVCPLPVQRMKAKSSRSREESITKLIKRDGRNADYYLVLNAGTCVATSSVVGALSHLLQSRAVLYIFPIVRDQFNGFRQLIRAVRLDRELYHLRALFGLRTAQHRVLQNGRLFKAQWYGKSMHQAHDGVFRSVLWPASSRRMPAYVLGKEVAHLKTGQASNTSSSHPRFRLILAVLDQSVMAALLVYGLMLALQGSALVPLGFATSILIVVTIAPVIDNPSTSFPHKALSLVNLPILLIVRATTRLI
jgi:hypothetical protein